MTDLDITLVIPARNAAKTIEPCMDAVVPMLEKGDLKEIILVDDGSTDKTARLVKSYPLRYIKGGGEGPGAARNLGWRNARTPLVWFVDADCVAEKDALSILMGHMGDPSVAGVGGSYGNMRPDSMLACLIHQEIVVRHARMPEKVDFLATFNVLYRRSLLEKIGGFNERFLKAQDAEMAFRVKDSGFCLKFDARSIVKHYHPTTFKSYFKGQREQGYWRAWLYFEHPGKAAGDSYSSFLDHVQPFLALLSIASAPFAPLGYSALMWGTITALMAIQLPMTARLLRRKGELLYLNYPWMAFTRAYVRAIGFCQGAGAVFLNALRRTS